MRSITSRPAQQLPSAQGQRKRGTEGVGSNQNAHNVVIVAFVTTVNAHSQGAPDDLTRRLVDEAGRLLLEYGIGGLSLRKLATAAGTSTMSVYTRFGGKQQLLAAMYRQGFDRLGASLIDASRTSGDPLHVLAEIGYAYRRAALASPTLYSLMFGPPIPGFEPSPENAAAARATYLPLLDAVRRCVDAQLLTGDPEQIALQLWAVVHGMVSLELAGQLPLDLSATQQAYARALVLAASPFLTTPPDEPSKGLSH
jgi:AcrR family transcriptional regulator